MPAWPNTLPQKPITDSYSESHPYPIISSPTDGPPLTRRRYTAAPKVISCSFVMSDDELAIFDAFFKDTIKHGSLSYTWFERGDPAKTGNFRITDAPKVTCMEYGTGSNSLWKVDLNLIKLP